MRSFLSSPLSALLLVLAIPLSARADVVGPPPTDYPAGTTGQSCHGNGFCTVRACTSDSECTGGQVCRTTGFCMGTVQCWGGGGPSAVATINGLCPRGDECATCQRARTCVNPTTPEPAPDGSTTGGSMLVGGCTCRVGWFHGPAGATALVGLGLGWALRRRRRR